MEQNAVGNFSRMLGWTCRSSKQDVLEIMNKLRWKSCKCLENLNLDLIFKNNGLDYFLNMMGYEYCRSSAGISSRILRKIQVKSTAHALITLAKFTLKFASDSKEILVEAVSLIWKDSVEIASIILSKSLARVLCMNLEKLNGILSRILVRFRARACSNPR